MRLRGEWLAAAMAELLSPTGQVLLVLAAGLLERLGGHPSKTPIHVDA
jgi:hypothetical protein